MRSRGYRMAFAGLLMAGVLSPLALAFGTPTSAVPQCTPTRTDIPSENIVRLTFTSTTECQYVANDAYSPADYDILVVGGGGGGGADGRGGGGGGEVRELVGQTLEVGTVLTIKVGAGGAGGVWNNTADGSSGGASRIAVGSTDLVKSMGGGGGTQSTYYGGVDSVPVGLLSDPDNVHTMGDTPRAGGGGAPGSGGVGGISTTSGRGGDASVESPYYSPTVPFQGTSGGTGVNAATGGAYFAGGGGGGICATSPSDSAITARLGGRGGGGNGASHSPTTYDTAGLAGTDNTGGGGGGGAGCNGGLVSGESKNTAGGAGGSGVVILEMARKVPKAPSGLTASVSGDTVVLSWTAGATGGPAITDYVVKWCTSVDTCTTYTDKVSASTSATLTSLPRGKALSFLVSAVNAVGTGPASRVWAILTTVTTTSTTTTTTTSTTTTSTTVPSTTTTALAQAGSNSSLPAVTVPQVTTTVPRTTTTVPRSTATTEPPDTPPATPEIVPEKPAFFDANAELVKFFEFEFTATAGAPVAGAPVAGTATGLEPGTPLRIILRSDPVVLGEFTAAQDGTASFEAQMPGEVPAGNHTLSIEATSAEGLPISSVTAFTVTSDGIFGKVLAAAELVSNQLDEAALSRSLDAGLAAYDPGRNVSRTVVIATTAVVLSSVSGLAAASLGSVSGASMSVSAPTTSSAGALSGGSGASPSGGSSAAGRQVEGPGRTGGGHADGGQSDPGIGETSDGGGSGGGGYSGYDSGDSDNDEGSGGDGGTPERDGDQEAEIGSADANLLDEFDDERDDRGSGFRLWGLPGFEIIDRLLRRLVTAAAPRSLLATRILQDGHWLRVAGGSVSAIVWFAALVMGASATITGSGPLVAPAYGVVAVVVVLALLDAMAGAAAWIALAVIGIITGRVTSIYDVRTLLGLAILFIALPSIGSAIRPFVRHIGGDKWARVDRVADYLIMPVFLSYAAASAYGALNALSGLAMVSNDHINSLRTVVFFGALARLACEDAVRVLLPSRSARLRIHVPTQPGTRSRLATLSFGSIMYMMAAAPFFGLGWRTWVTVGLTSLVPALKLVADRFPNQVVLHRWFPRGILRTVMMMFVSASFGRFVFSLAGDGADAKSVAVFLLLPGIVVSVLDMFAREGGDWPDNPLKRVAGLGLWVVAVGVLSGHIAP